MWSPSSAGACLCRHLPVWSLFLHRHHFACPGPLPVDTFVLYSNSLHRPEDAIHYWETEGFFHMCLSSHLCHPLLQHSMHDLSTAQIQVLTRHQETDVIGLLSAHPSAESTYLQPEKQGDEKGCGKIMAKKSDFTHRLICWGTWCFSIMLLNFMNFGDCENRVHFLVRVCFLSWYLHVWKHITYF